MSKKVLFNGVVLERPGAATKIDASRFQNISLDGIGIVAIIGEGESGPRGLSLHNSAASVKATYLTGDLVEAAQMLSNPHNDPRLAAGASAIVCYKVNNSTQASFVHASTLTFKTKRYGLGANFTTVAVAAGTGSSRIVTITAVDEFGLPVTEVSPELGGTGKFTLIYTGAGTSPTVTVTGTTLTTSITGAAGDQLNITLADYTSMADLLTFINNTGKYTATALATNLNGLSATYLDPVTAQSITTAYALSTRNYDIADWINTNSQLLTVTLALGQAAPVATLTKTALTGGTRGTSDNTAWVAAFTALRTVRCNQMVPLVSKDATVAQGTFTFSAISAAFAAHLNLVNSTYGRNECQGWYGMEGTKTAIITQLQAQNNMHLCMVAQKPLLPRQADAVQVYFPEWAYACLLAGARAGAPLGEPLTWKYLNSYGSTSDASWSESNDDDVKDLMRAGLTVINYINGKGYRIDKCVTTYTRTDNDAYTEETVVQIWKAFAYDVRSKIEEALTGRPGFLASNVANIIVDVGDLYERNGAIMASTENGRPVKACRNISYSLAGDVLTWGCTITPTPGINFEIGSISLVPAVISG